MFRHKRQEAANQGRRTVLRDTNRAQTFSYRANRVEQEYNVGRAQPREQDIRRRERLIRFWRQRLAVLLMGLLVIGCLLYILHLSSSAKVIPLTTSSNDYFLQPTQVYTKAADALLQQNWLNDNKITVDTDTVKLKLQQQFPELASVSITLPLMSHRPIVYIAPTTPSVILQSGKVAYILDSNGKALVPTSRVADLTKLQLPVVVDQTDSPLKANAVALPATSVNFIQTVLAELQAKGIPAQTITLPQAAYELDVTPRGVGYYGKFNLHDYASAQQQVGTFLAVKQRLASQGVTPSYIDVRLAGRAYYK